MKSKIWLSSPHIGSEEQEFVNQAFASNWIAPLGPNVDGFENDIATFLGNNVKVAALSSGTAAIHLGLIMLGVQAGDEVICQSFTFSASANPIIYQGATPIFVDSEVETYNMSPYWLRKAIEYRLAKGKKPKAIIPVHLYGMPANMPELSAIAAEYNIPILEDAAEALGSSINGRLCGTFGEIGVLSFNGNKIITTSSGGALVAQNPEYIEKAKFLSTQARDQAPHYQHSHIGYNYRMSNVCAGIGRGQMAVLNSRIKSRRSNFEYYRKELAEIKGIQFLEEPQGYFSNRWLTTIVVTASNGANSCEKIRMALEAENIESRPLWKPMHMQPVFANAPYYGENICEKLFGSGLCLPSGSNMTEEDAHRVVESIKRIF